MSTSRWASSNSPSRATARRPETEDASVRAAAAFGLGRIEYARARYREAMRAFRQARELYAGQKLGEEETARWQGGGKGDRPRPERLRALCQRSAPPPYRAVPDQDLTDEVGLLELRVLLAVRRPRHLLRM